MTDTAQTLNAIDAAINERYSQGGATRVIDQAGNTALSAWDRAEMEKMAPAGQTVEGWLAGLNADQRQRALDDLATRAQATTIGGLSIATHGDRETYAPWHVGFTEKAGVTVCTDEQTVFEAGENAGLFGWDVRNTPAMRRDTTTGELVTSKQHSLLVLPANPALKIPADVELGRAGADWNPISNEAVATALDGLRGDSPDPIRCESAGWLKGRTWTFFQLQIGETRFVLGDDPYKLYVGVHNPFTGWDATKLLITGVRTLCDNTFRLGEIHARALERVIHTGDTEAKLGPALAQMLRANGYMDQFAKDAERLARVDVSVDRFRDLAAELLPDPDDPVKSKITADRRARQRDELVELYTGNPRTETLEPTGYKAMQTVNDWSTWVRDPKDDGRNRLARLSNVWNGDGTTVSLTRQARAWLTDGPEGGTTTVRPRPRQAQTRTIS
jgi:phage/plasmid-like protein (TIGR03299 family)